MNKYKPEIILKLMEILLDVTAFSKILGSLKNCSSKSYIKPAAKIYYLRWRYADEGGKK